MAALSLDWTEEERTRDHVARSASFGLAVVTTPSRAKIMARHYWIVFAHGVDPVKPLAEGVIRARRENWQRAAALAEAALATLPAEA